MPLVEREHQLAALRQYAHEAGAGEGRVVLVTAEAGGGKSVLLEQLQSELTDARWAWGTCDGLTTPRPLAPLADLAHDLGGPVRELLRECTDRERLFRALLDQVSEVPGLDVVVVEDIHWADEATLDLLRFVSRRIRNVATLLIVSYRSDGVAPVAPLQLAIGELGSLRWSRRVELPPLSAEAVAALVAPAGLAADDVFRLTGGNPFYVTEMVAAGTSDVPRTARDAVLARAARLGDEAWQVLSYASLIGIRIEPGLLRDATQVPPVVLDEVLGSGLLVDDGETLRFRHEIARRAVEHQVPTHRRADIHAGVLESLAKSGCTDDSRMAFHAEGAGDGVAVLLYATRAARRAVSLASHREATAQYERALRFAEDADLETRAELYSALAQEAALQDAVALAASANESALALWRELGDRRQEGETLRRQGYALLNLCRGQEALRAASAAVDALEPLGNSAELADACAMLACSRMMRGEWDEACQLAERARSIAQQVGAPAVVADAMNTQACAVAATDDGWQELMRGALELSLSQDLQQQAARAFVNLHTLLVDRYRHSEAEQVYRDGLAYCIEHDLDTYAYCLHASETEMTLNQGRWDETLALSQRLLREHTVAPISQVCLNIRMGLVLSRRGDLESWAPLDRALPDALNTTQPQYIVAARLARAEAFWLAGRNDEAQQEIEAALECGENRDPWQCGDVQTWLQRTGSDRRLQQEVAAPHALSAAGRHREAAQLWAELGSSYRAGLSLLDTGDEESVREALTRFDALGAAAAARITRLRLRELGARSIPAGPRRATREDPLGLTPRERQVLELLCARRTNAQIARELVISPKTVDHHVSAVLSKLGANNRDSAAETARELGLVCTN